MRALNPNYELVLRELAMCSVGRDEAYERLSDEEERRMLVNGYAVALLLCNGASPMDSFLEDLAKTRTMVSSQSPPEAGVQNSRGTDPFMKAAAKLLPILTIMLIRGR